MLDLSTALGHAGVPDPQRHRKVVKRPAGKRAVMMRLVGTAPAPVDSDSGASVSLRRKKERGHAFWQVMYKQGKDKAAVVQFTTGRLHLGDGDLESAARAGLEKAREYVASGMQYEQLKDAMAEFRNGLVASG
eukprot:5855004-Lingulodinium_polyedra.AAC.1